MRSGGEASSPVSLESEGTEYMSSLRIVDRKPVVLEKTVRGQASLMDLSARRDMLDGFSRASWLGLFLMISA